MLGPRIKSIPGTFLKSFAPFDEAIQPAMPMIVLRFDRMSRPAFPSAFLSAKSRIEQVFKIMRSASVSSVAFVSPRCSRIPVITSLSSSFI